MIVTSRESEPNVQVVLGAIETVFNRHETGAVDIFFSDDFVQHSPYVPPGGKRELAQWWRRTVEAIPDISGAVEHIVAAEDTVAVFRTLRGTVRKDLPELGIKGHGQLLEFRVAHLFQLRDGKVVGHWETMDTGPATRLALEPA